MKKGKDCVNKSEPLFRVVIGEINNNPNRFFLLFSLSHVLGDGHTFYKLYSMLSTECEPQPLEAERNYSKAEEVASLSREPIAAFSTAGLICNMIGKYFFGKRCKVSIKEIDS